MASTTLQHLPALREATTHQLMLPEASPEIIEQAMQIGDIKLMSPQIRVAYYIQTCLSIGLNPYTQPFDLIEGDDGKVRQYPNKSCAEQIRKRDQISLLVVSRLKDGDLYIVTVKATTPNGREEEAQGIVSLVKPVGQWKPSTSGKRYFEATKDAHGNALYEPLRGTELANAIMRGETKAKRRATLGIAGLGYEENEPQGPPMSLNLATGELGTSALPTVPLRLAEAQKTLADHIEDLTGVRPPDNAQEGPPLPQEDGEEEKDVLEDAGSIADPRATAEAHARDARRQRLCLLVVQSQRSLKEYITRVAKRCAVSPDVQGFDPILDAIPEPWIEGLIKEAETYLQRHPPQPEPGSDESILDDFVTKEPSLFGDDEGQEPHS